MSEKQRSSNFEDGFHVIHASWVQKLTRGQMPYMKWKKRWMVVRSNGELYSYKERPKSLLNKTPHLTLEIGPESIIRLDKKAKTASFTIGEEAVARVVAFRIVSPSNESPQGEDNWHETKKWYSTLKGIVLRKRMWYVLQLRFRSQEELKPSFPTLASPPRLYEQKRVSKALGNTLDEKFDKYSQLLWQKGLRWRGHNIYYEFNISDIEILWYMYAKHKLYIPSDCLELLLGDAFATAYGTKGTHIKQNSQNFCETISDRAYSAMVFLDSDKKDGFVDFEDFKLINTMPFWKNVDFLTPILPDHETYQLWLSVFQCLEDTGTLSKNIIHRLWMRYSAKHDGYLYQQDLEEFLADFMDATVERYPDIDEDLAENFHTMISTRAAIALRFLTGDESAKVTIQQFAAVGQEDFWVCVDFFPTEEKKEDDVKNESCLPVGTTILYSEPSVGRIIRSLSGGALFEVDSDDSSDNEHEDTFTDAPQKPEEETRIWEGTEEKLEISIEGSRKSFAVPSIPEQIVEKSMSESDLTDSVTDSASDDLSPVSLKAEIMKKERIVYSTLNESGVPY